MSTLRVLISVGWAVFWVGWLLAAFRSKPGTRTWRGRPLAFVIIAVGVVGTRAVGVKNPVLHGPIVQGLGVVMFVSGLALAVWARVYLGRNWGMPMTQKDEPELVTSGPYRFIRHPIYSGILLAAIGTALAVTLYWLIVSAGIAVYFIYSARVEEQIMTSLFPTAYPSYRARTKMLIPFVI